MLISASQCRMARAALGMSMRELAMAAGVSVNTLGRIEGDGNVTSRTLVRVQEILARSGVVFRRDGSVGIGQPPREDP
ncbi:transcriptional regulator [Pseudoroseomonas rhizosphaerae]|uniref:Transcriptional regulator n=1 Tax=Teichococcus rhizosphaerae TaxID=1335062 RepID=A0A2C7A9K4_9PROT|nr:helix-turn-helix transcriptional regulator [Pseudoroseomonas rhizosphaerae]PHK93734.1 transcriptional regulator [Pseudoroseomonas rhizosphaerae]